MHLLTQLHSALEARVVIEQAKGMLAETENISPSQALTALREHARQRDLRLTELAHALINGKTRNLAAVGTNRHPR